MRLLVSLGFAAIVLLARAEDALPTKTALPVTNALVLSAATRNCEIVATIIQLSPRKKTNDLETALSKADSVLDLTRILNGYGPVRIIFNAAREVVEAPGATVNMESWESRPTFVMKGITPKSSDRLGVTLDLNVIRGANQRSGETLTIFWSGLMGYSPELLENAKWEKGLMMLFNVANSLGAGFYDEPKKRGIRQQGGVNVVALFSKKVKAEESDPVNHPQVEKEISYLGNTLQQTPLNGAAMLANGKLTVIPLTHTDPANGLFYLVLQYSLL